MAENRRRFNLTPPPARVSPDDTSSRRAERRAAQQEAQANQPEFLDDPMFEKENLMDAATFVAEATPIVGDVMAAREVYDELQKENPNYYLAGALGGAAIIGLIPGVGDAAAQAIRTGARRGLDFARRIEVDPNALGSNLGNVRLRPETVDDLPPPEAAQRTQIAGTLPTYRKANDLLTEEVGEGATLDFGAGLGLSQRELGFDTFEPFPREGFNPTYSSAADIPDESYERLTNLNVLNVVPRETRDEIVRDIGRILKPGGVGIITTRGRDVMSATGRAGPEDMSIITSAGTYQKGFTQPELREYIQETLGEGFEVTNNRLGAAGVTIRKLSEERGFNDGGLAVESSLVPRPRPTQEDREERQRRIDEGLRQRELGEQFGNIEFEADMYSKGYLDPLSRLGLDAEVAKTVPARYGFAGVQVRGLSDTTDAMQENRDEAGYTDPIQEGDVLTIGDYSGSNTVWTHEFRHRGMEKLRDKLGGWQNFVDQYLPDADDNTLATAALVFSGREEELLVDYMDRRSPEELGFDTENLSNDYAGIKERFREPLAKVEEALMQAARDTLTEEGSPPPAEMQEREERGWLPRMLDSLFGRKEGFSKGGMAMDDQMKNLLEEGGLTDDGMERDPISGNEVPPGSMAEEVRDDIDAQLSGGEYVVPADVVRYYGVKFFEDIREQAKEGLNEMEETGRIGGESIPMEEVVRREQAANDMGMAQGGTVPVSDLSQMNVIPNYPQTMNALPSMAKGGQVKGYVDGGLETGVSQVPDSSEYLQTPYRNLADLFADFARVGSYTQRIREGRPAPGTPTTPTTDTGNIEYRTYVGPNGEIRQIPFLNGEPQIEIPEGFRPQGDVTQAPQVTTPTVSEGDSGDSGVQAPDTRTTLQRQQADLDAALEDANYEDPITTGMNSLSGTSTGIGSIAGGIIGLLAGGPMGARLGAKLGQVADEAGRLADAAVNAEVAGILGYDTTDLDTAISSSLDDMGLISKPFATTAVQNARTKAREAFFNPNSSAPLTRGFFQSDESYTSALDNLARSVEERTGAEPGSVVAMGQYDSDNPDQFMTDYERARQHAEQNPYGQTTGRFLRSDNIADLLPPASSTSSSASPSSPPPDTSSGGSGGFDSDSGGYSGPAAGDTSNVGSWFGDRDGDGVQNWRDFNDGVGANDNNTDGGGSSSGSGKIVCTAMNTSYGFGSYRQAIWLKYSETNLTEYHEKGYHKIFLPLVDRAYNRGENNSKVLRVILENIARHRTADLRAEMQGKKRDKLGRVYRTILEPVCYIVGRLSK